MSLHESIQQFRQAQLRVEALDEAMRGNPSAWQRIKRGAATAALGAAAMFSGASGARADELGDATAAHHYGPHFANIQRNVGRDLPGGERAISTHAPSVATIRGAMARTNPADTSGLSPENQAGLARAQAAYRGDISRAQTPQEKQQRLASAGGHVHTAVNMLRRQQARAARRAAERAQDMSPRGTSATPVQPPVR